MRPWNVVRELPRTVEIPVEVPAAALDAVMAAAPAAIEVCRPLCGLEVDLWKVRSHGSQWARRDMLH